MTFFTPYPPEMYFTTFLNSKFPEHDNALRMTRHTMGSFTTSINSQQPWQVPRADVTESKDKFFIDVELPGVESTQNIKVKWTNSRTLLMDANLGKLAVHTVVAPGNETEQHGCKSTNVDGTAITTGSGSINVDSAQRKDKNSSRNKAEAIHMTVHERWQGHTVRAFCFPVDVNSEAVEAHLKAGVLRMMIPKTEFRKVVESRDEE
jgi:HSP20 family protein